MIDFSDRTKPKSTKPNPVACVHSRTIMKLHNFQLILISFLCTIIIATPLQSTEIEDIPEPNILQPVGFHVDSDLSQHLEKRETPVCSATECGELAINNCMAELNLEAAVKASQEVCAAKGVAVVLSGDCEVTFGGGDKVPPSTTCITQGKLTQLAMEVFKVCVNNTKAPTGGCIDNGSDGGRVCLRSSTATCT